MVLVLHGKIFNPVNVCVTLPVLFMLYVTVKEVMVEPPKFLTSTDTFCNPADTGCIGDVRLTILTSNADDS